MAESRRDHIGGEERRKLRITALDLAIHTPSRTLEPAELIERAKLYLEFILVHEEHDDG